MKQFEKVLQQFLDSQDQVNEPSDTEYQKNDLVFEWQDIFSPGLPTVGYTFVSITISGLVTRGPIYRIEVVLLQG